MPSSEHPGQSGWARWHALEVGASRLRLIELSPAYVANHWCTRGHVILMLAGEVVTEQQDGGELTLGADQWYQLADGGQAHRLRSAHGARLFVVD